MGATLPGPDELRSAIDEAASRGEAAQARDLMGQLWRRDPRAATASFLVSKFELIRGMLATVPCRVAFLRSFTVEPVEPILRVEAAVTGLDVRVHFGGFNAYVQEILDPQSGLYAFAPDIAVLAVQTRDVAPQLWRGFADLRSEEVAETVRQLSKNFRAWVAAFRSRSQAHLIIHTLELPEHPAAGILDAQSPDGQFEAIRAVNRELLAIAREHSGVYLLDYDALIAAYGRGGWHDEEKWTTMRMPIAAAAIPSLAREYMRFLCPLMGRSCKVLVVDLDNTLWGGVVGEDGSDGIRLGGDHPGAAYLNLQRAILDLYRRGVLLAVASKNNAPEALAAIDEHPHMLLRRDHFSALEIHWNDKASSLRAIAAALDLGTDSLALLDDSETERHWVRSQMPEVTVIDLPQSPWQYAETLRRSPVFERLKVSDEDRARARYYADESRRSELQQQAGSLEDFYRSLAMQAELALVSPETLPRTAQLTQKTNQFNLTTRRYSEQQIAAMTSSPDWRWYTLRVRDRFGDNGLVAIAGIHRRGAESEIDTFLMSCRVIGRTVETALLAAVAADASAGGASKLTGWFIPTKKNAPAKNFYTAHGFSQMSSRDEDGASFWALDLTKEKVIAPPWIQVATHLVQGPAQ